jgi:hypothetical protein
MAGATISSGPAPSRSASVAAAWKPRLTWFSLVRTAGAENAGSSRTGNPGTGVPSAFQAYTCSPAVATTSGSRSPSMSPTAGVRSTSRGASIAE